MILLFSAILPCIVVIALGIFHVYFYKTNTTNEEVRSALYFVIAMPPITVMGAIIGMFIPRAAGFLYAVTTTYYMLALYMMVDLMFTMFYGKRALSRYLQEKSKRIVLKPKFLKIFRCIPDFTVKPSIENLLRIEALIIQTVFVRILMQICELVVYFELRRKSNMWVHKK
ncbi:hypothetical protein GCK32_010794 [Trichostrongylus colubriformis]|uniref:Uncharacterized protein n=1 Tax=Trichostrongylus colubriformis TaxID=6319 RepID=A0AAN8FTS3_TRICO